MRTTALIIALVAAALVPLTAEEPVPLPKSTAPAAEQKPADEAALRKQVSYLVGLQIKGMVDNAVTKGELDRAEILRGFQDGEAGKAKEPSQAEQQALFQSYGQIMQAKAAKAGDGQLTDNAAYLADHAKKPGVMSTASGLQYEVVAKGKDGGKQPKSTSKVKVNYVGTKRDGTLFDSSEKNGGPIEFALNRVIKGWTEGVQLMREGDKYRFTIPSDLAYGPRGPEGIGDNQVLIFEVELLAVISDAK
ncbi:MAG: FKBP-type peptidyl-prolyl cis-trans isomerase [Planctomycetota bacterium]